MKQLIVCLSAVFLVGILSAQTDSLPRTFKKIDIFPAISYAPETKLTLGAIGYYYFDLAKQSTATRLSNVNFLAAYTLANQIVIESRWDIFTDDNKWRYRGEVFFNRYPDRNYGLGNDANLLIAEITDDQTDTLNYLRFDSDRIKFAPIVLKRVSRYLFVGLQAELEMLNRFKVIPDDYYPLNEESQTLLDFPVEGRRIGIGVNLLFDSRDNIINPLSGTYFEFSNHFYHRAVGSDFDYSSFRFDGRHYVKVAGNQTLAMRGVVNLRFSEELLPLRGLSRVGGRDFIRGYFQGAFQNNHLLAFELEYRWPFWKEDLDAPVWKIWKRMGVVGFIGGAQVQKEIGDFQFDAFNLAAGGGLRFLFNKSSRLNIRIDYGFGLRKDSGGLGKRQSGLYFFLAEAF